MIRGAGQVLKPVENGSYSHLYFRDRANALTIAICGCSSEKWHRNTMPFASAQSVGAVFRSTKSPLAHSFQMSMRLQMPILWLSCTGVTCIQHQAKSGLHQ
jgi:hypothetical protein